MISSISQTHRMVVNVSASGEREAVIGLLVGAALACDDIVEGSAMWQFQVGRDEIRATLTFDVNAEDVFEGGPIHCERRQVARRLAYNHLELGLDALNAAPPTTPGRDSGRS